MKATLRLGACLLLASLLALPTAVAAQPLETLKAGVVRIHVTKTDGGKDTGAGNVIGVAENGTVFILTAFHVVEDHETIKVSFDKTRWEEYDAKVFRFDDQMDIAAIFVKLEKPPSDLPKYEVRTSRPKDGEKVETIGHPPNLPWEDSSETVVRTTDPDDTRMFRISKTQIDRGNSGGPVFDERGALLGTVIKMGKNYATVVLIEDTLQKLQDWKAPSNHLSEEARTGTEVAGQPSALPPTTKGLPTPPAREPATLGAAAAPAARLEPPVYLYDFTAADGSVGMLFSSAGSLSGAYGRSARLEAYFWFANGTPLRSAVSAEHQVSSWLDFQVDVDPQDLSQIKLFVPYVGFNLAPSNFANSYPLMVRIQILVDGAVVAVSEPTYFTVKW